MTYSDLNIDELIIRFLAGETNKSENRSLANWINESPDNKSYFYSIRNVWLASSPVISAISSLTSNISTQDEIIKERTIVTGKKYRLLHKEITHQLLKIAAILIIVVLTGIIINAHFEKKASSNNIIAIESPLGSRAITTLRDGTKVWLNSGSKLTYNGTYDESKRDVWLTGEAYFDVVTNPSKPFIVKTSKLSIKATGTIFNVKAYPEDDAITTTLVEGKVFIEGKDVKNKSFSLQMKPKETVTYYKENQLLSSTVKLHQNRSAKPETKNNFQPPIVKNKNINTELYTSWKDDRWIIKKQKLGDLSLDLERRYNIKIQFSSDSIKQFHFTGILENETIEQVMLIMSHTIPIKYKIEKGMISIEEDPELMKKFYK